MSLCQRLQLNNSVHSISDCIAEITMKLLKLQGNKSMKKHKSSSTITMQLVNYPN